MIEVDGKIPMRWWDNTDNFGDLLGPWLVTKMTGKPVFWEARENPHYMTIGSILGRVRSTAVVWGTGSFGSEPAKRLSKEAPYLAVRGPLTRSKLEMHGIECPRVYGDPALLAPDYYKSPAQKKHKLGVVLRWSEEKRKKSLVDKGVHVIDLQTKDIEGVLDGIQSCERILTSSLHGLVLSDAYGIPNAWLSATTGAGKEFKYWDYLISVKKVRDPVGVRLSERHVDEDYLLNTLNFDDRAIQIDLDLLRSTCPFLHSDKSTAAAEERVSIASAEAKKRKREKKLRLASV